MADKNSGSRDTEEIRRDIQDTRSRMSTTMDALETRLSPERLKREATGAIRENTVGRVERFADTASETVKGTGANVFETIKKNPLPAALAAIGLGWLLMESRNQNRGYAQPRYSNAGRYSRYDRYDPYGYRYGVRGEPGYGEGVQGKAQQVAGQAQDKAQQVAGQVQDTAHQVADQAQYKAQQVAGQVQDTASQVADQAQAMVGQAQDQVSEWADAAQEQMGQFGTRFEQMFEENPMLIGAAAMALGAAVGFGLPTTQKENELLGEKRDQFVEKAQSKAQDTMEKVQQVAQKAGEAAKETAKDEAQKQNLTSGA